MTTRQNSIDPAVKELATPWQTEVIDAVNRIGNISEVARHFGKGRSTIRAALELATAKHEDAEAFKQTKRK